MDLLVGHLIRNQEEPLDPSEDFVLCALMLSGREISALNDLLWVRLNAKIFLLTHTGVPAATYMFEFK